MVVDGGQSVRAMQQHEVGAAPAVEVRPVTNYQIYDRRQRRRGVVPRQHMLDARDPREASTGGPHRCVGGASSSRTGWATPTSPARRCARAKQCPAKRA